MEQTTPKQAPPKFVRWAVLIGIVVALNIFFLVARSLIFTQPDFATFCPAANGPAPVEEKACVAAEGTWINQPVTDPKGATTPGGYCDTYSKCQKPYEDAQKTFALYSFVLTVGLGILSIIVGVLPIGSSIVSSGLSYGGVLAFIIASIQYWNDAGSLVRLAISVLALGVLIYIGIRRFKD